MELTREIRDMRVAICRDVLERLQQEKLELTHEHFVAPRSIATTEESAVELRHLVATNPGDAQPVIDEIERHCCVCARGAVMLSAIRKFDKVQVCDLFVTYGDTPCTSREITTRNLDFVFDAVTLELIEAAYEHTIYARRYASYDQVVEARAFGEMYAAGAFGNIYAASNDCLAAIMNNIIWNDGEFRSDCPVDAL